MYAVRGATMWRVHQSLTVKCPEAANAEALKLLDSGVDSLGFSLTKGLSAAEVETLLRDIHLPAVEVVFSGEGVADVVEPVLAKIEKEGWQETASVHFVLDPIINRLSLTGAFCSPGGEVLQDAGRSGAPYGRDEGRARGDGVGRELFERRFDHRRGAGLHPFRPATNTSCG